MIQFRKSGVVVDLEDVATLKVEFETRHCVLLPHLVDPSLLGFLLERLRAGVWCDEIHGKIAREDMLHDDLAFHLLHFCYNNSQFLEVVREITGLRTINAFRGRVYRMLANPIHFDSWHNDTLNDRLVGTSLNLSPTPYAGGVFQLREKQSKQMLMEIANTGLGNATLFRISEALEHRVTNVEGEEAKVAFAGWFYPGETEFLNAIRQPRSNSSTSPEK